MFTTTKRFNETKTFLEEKLAQERQANATMFQELVSLRTSHQKAIDSVSTLEQKLKVANATIRGYQYSLDGIKKLAALVSKEAESL